jgi:hypothetical protein
MGVCMWTLAVHNHKCLGPKSSIQINLNVKVAMHVHHVLYQNHISKNSL